MRGPYKTKAALQGRLSYLTNNIEDHITEIDLVNQSTYLSSGYESMTYKILSANMCFGTREKVRYLINKDFQPFGSMPSRFNFSRHASFTHELNFPCPAASSIWQRRSSSKRIFFFVLPERSKADLLVLSCIGTYRCYKLDINGTYHCEFSQPLNAMRPRSARTLAGPLTKPLKEVTIMADIQSTQTRPKYQYRFLALDRANRKAIPCRLSVEAFSEQEARQILSAHFILSLAARLPVKEVRRA